MISIVAFLAPSFWMHIPLRVIDKPKWASQEVKGQMMCASHYQLEPPIYTRSLYRKSCICTNAYQEMSPCTYTSKLFNLMK